MLSPHFSEREFTFSRTADRFGINNSLPHALRNDAKWFCQTVLEPLREFLGKPIHITSGYRCPELNRRVGGSTHSYHQRGWAADITVPGKTPAGLADAVHTSGLPFDQLILEPSWVHIQARPPNRGRLLTAVVADGRTQYQPGLLA